MVGDGQNGSVKPIDLTSDSISNIIQSKTKGCARRLWVGYSGGVDSHVLLHLVAACCDPLSGQKYDLRAIHIDHGLSPNEKKWTAHCQQVCCDLAVPFEAVEVDARVREGRSPEEVGRAARLQVWKEKLSARDVLLLAHHVEDQAETILLRLFRGAGPLGLSGMEEAVSFGEFTLIRPLLKTPKSQILAYAKAHQLNWVEDEDNQKLRFDRNFLRQQIFPLLKERWSQVTHSITRAGELCGELSDWMEWEAKKDFETIQAGHDKSGVSIPALLALAPVRRQEVLRYWLRGLGCSVPSRSHMERIEREILRATHPHRARLKIGDYLLLRSGEMLCIEVSRPLT